MAKRNVIGIDLAKDIFQVCVVSRDGKIKTNKKIRRHKLADFIARQPRNDKRRLTPAIPLMSKGTGVAVCNE